MNKKASENGRFFVHEDLPHTAILLNPVHCEHAPELARKL